MSTYRYIAQRQGQVPVRQLCQVLRVSASAYYALYDCTAFRREVARKGNGVTNYA